MSAKARFRRWDAVRIVVCDHHAGLDAVPDGHVLDLLRKRDSVDRRDTVRCRIRLPADQPCAVRESGRRVGVQRFRVPRTRVHAGTFPVLRELLTQCPTVHIDIC